MLKPILIGAPDCAAASPVSAAAMTAATAAAASAELSLKRMSFPPYEFFRDCPRAGCHITATSKRCARGAALRPIDAPRPHPSPLAWDGSVASPPSTTMVSTSPAPLRRNAAGEVETIVVEGGDATLPSHASGEG